MDTVTVPWKAGWQCIFKKTARPEGSVVCLSRHFGLLHHCAMAGKWNTWLNIPSLSWKSYPAVKMVGRNDNKHLLVLWYMDDCLDLKGHGGWQMSSKIWNSWDGRCSHSARFFYTLGKCTLYIPCHNFFWKVLARIITLCRGGGYKTNSTPLQIGPPRY